MRADITFGEREAGTLQVQWCTLEELETGAVPPRTPKHLPMLAKAFALYRDTKK